MCGMDAANLRLQAYDNGIARCRALPAEAAEGSEG